MSRVRPIEHNGDKFWFDTRKNAHQASVQHLELLSDVSGVPLDDLLDEGLIQAQVIDRIREYTDPDSIPDHVLEARKRQRELQRQSSVCRICSVNGWKCEGIITKHHFVPRWMMLELENYVAYSSRAKCTIPICLGRHRDLHSRADGSDKSIVQYLTSDEREFAQKMLDELKEEHPAIFDLIVGGDSNFYEAQLTHDYQRGEFRSSRGAYEHD